MRWGRGQRRGHAGLVGLGGILSLVLLFHGLVVSPHLTVNLTGAETTVQSIASAPSMVPGASGCSLSGCLLTLLSHWLTLSGASKLPRALLSASPQVLGELPPGQQLLLRLQVKQAPAVSLQKKKAAVSIAANIRVLPRLPAGTPEALLELNGVSG